MAEAHRWEAERSAWIKERTWLDTAGAARRAELLARRARKLERAASGVGESALHEAELPSRFKSWTSKTEDASSAAVMTLAYVLLTGFVVFWFGLAWIIGQGAYRAWESAATTKRVLIWLYLVAAAGVAFLAWVGRPMGLDLWLIHGLASIIEAATGGWIGPAALSRWYAASWVSWMEIQVVIGLLYAGWLAYAWGWAAPAIRRQEQATKDDLGVRIISGAESHAAQDAPQTDGPAQSSAIKIIPGAKPDDSKED